jgi:hypothetical protein
MEALGDNEAAIIQIVISSFRNKEKVKELIFSPQKLK